MCWCSTPLGTTGNPFILCVNTIPDVTGEYELLYVILLRANLKIKQVHFHSHQYCIETWIHVSNLDPLLADPSEGMSRTLHARDGRLQQHLQLQAHLMWALRVKW